MRVLLVSSGSLGDTLPFLSWAKVLLERGHRVTMMGSGYYRSLFDSAGIAFEEMWSDQQHRQLLESTSFWNHSHDFRSWHLLLPQMIERAFHYIEKRYVPGETVVAAQGMYFGARIAQEKLGVPLATVHLQPLFMRSVYDPTGVPRWVPRIAIHAGDWAFDVIGDGFAGKAVNGFRARLGMKPVRRIFKHWCNSPDLVLGFFPAFFSSPQRDWPRNCRLVGFPIPQVGDDSFDRSELERFLTGGSPPLVFTVSSLTRDANRFFEVSIDISRQLGRRALFLTPQEEQVPAQLPADMRHFKFVPLNELLPRSAAHIHHAGSGSIAQTLAAGIPQVTVPQGVDQGDLSMRLERLGVSAHIKRGRYTPDVIVPRLRHLLESPAVAERCRHYAELSRAMRPLEDASEALEQMELSPIASVQPLSTG